MENDNYIIGSNLRQFRVRLGMSQQELAAYLNVTASCISHYENGERGVPTDSLERAASLFGISAYDFYEKNAANKTANTAFAFRAGELEPTDLDEIARFRTVVRNFISMKNKLKRYEGQERK
ncbi:helix-turn-helix domain-containing protein [Dyadobacter soli]|nr:helix-turn-helix transcriptional regulator [Dyadobacter soli]